MTSFGGAGGLFFFSQSATAASASFDIISGQGIEAQLNFNDSTTAANATITVANALVSFFGHSTAANAVIQADAGGFLIFGENATADHTIVTFSSDGAEFVGSGITLRDPATAANGTFNADGATSSTGFASYVTCIGSIPRQCAVGHQWGSSQGAAGTVMTLYDTSTADNATVTVNGGTNGQGRLGEDKTTFRTAAPLTSRSTATAASTSTGRISAG